MQEIHPFTRALPVWPKALAGQMNIWLSFHCSVHVRPRTRVTLRLGAASAYRVWINGNFTGQGPARTAHGHARVDVWPGHVDKNGRVTIAIEVADYGVPTLCATNEPAFCCAELVANNKVLAWTAPSGSGFVAERRPERVQRIERYSFQRAFCEAYRVGRTGFIWQRGDYAPTQPLVLARAKFQPRWLLRGVGYPDMKKCVPLLARVRGNSRFSALQATRVKRRRFIHEVPQTSQGFRLSKVEWPLFDSLAGLKFRSRAKVRGCGPARLGTGEWLRVDFGTVHTGFPMLHILAQGPTRLLLMFDEVLLDEQIVFDRLDCVNALWLDLAEGTDIDFQAFEPYSFRYLQVLVWTGNAAVTDLRLRNFINAEPMRPTPAKLAARLVPVRRAAVASFRHNAVDILMDCPSRERAGWLVDSLFTARAEWHLCGDNPIERAFLENYLRPAAFSGLPRGMVPMCYPAETLLDGMFIPNWAMFLVLQLEEAMRLRRLPSSWLPLVERRVRGLLRYFQQFENEIGLLEKLEGWIFVEWSRANEFVQDVNFPTNMLYAATLRAASRLLREPRWSAKASRLDASIRALAWCDGRFVDNAVRDKDGRLVTTEHASEVCQYYAFFTGLASPAGETALWRRLVHSDYGALYPANAFIGKLLRLELLIEHGEMAAARRELQQSYATMARATGTLWEHLDAQASCNHGFTSYVAVLIDRLGRMAIHPR